jgi:hypothetical protein
MIGRPFKVAEARLAVLYNHYLFDEFLSFWLALDGMERSFIPLLSAECEKTETLILINFLQKLGFLYRLCLNGRQALFFGPFTTLLTIADN